MYPSPAGGPPASVAVLFSEASRAAYAVEAARRGGTYTFPSAWGRDRTWLKGQWAYLAPNAACALLNRCNLKHDLLEEAELLERGLASLRALIVPNAGHLRPETIAAVRAWLDQGHGHLLVTGRTNLPDDLLGLDSRARFVTVPPLAPGQTRTLRFEEGVAGAPRVTQPGHSGLEILEARHHHATGETLLRLSVCRRQSLLLHGVDPRRRHTVAVDGGAERTVRAEAGHSVQAILSTTAGTDAAGGPSDAATAFLRIAVEGEENRHVERVVRVRALRGA